MRLPLCYCLVLYLLTACTPGLPLATSSRSRGPLELGFAESVLVDAANFDSLFETFEDSHPVTTWTDNAGVTHTTTGDGFFQGCPSEPLGAASGRPYCVETYTDKNGNGTFDGAFLAGFDSSRAAVGVHDPLKVSAWVVRTGTTVAGFATLDAVGYHYSEVELVQQDLRSQGLNFQLLIISSTHDHEAPDLMGQWGPHAGVSFDAIPLASGITAPYREHVRRAVARALTAAYANLAPGSLCPARASSSVNPLFTQWPSAHEDLAYQKAGVGMRNPKAHGARKYLIEGLENDHRDPLLFNPDINVLQARNASGAVRATVINTHSHPEVLWSQNREITADYTGYVRDRLTQLFPGSLGINVIGSVGGIIGPHEVPIALRGPDGNVALTDLTDLNGSAVINPQTGRPYRVPVIAPDESFEKSRALGYTYAELAARAVSSANCFDSGELRVAEKEFLMPIENPAFVLAGFLQVFPRPVYDKAGNVIRGDVVQALGYYPNEPIAYVKTKISAARLLLGETDALTLVSAPGEMFPESVIGYPADLEDPARENDYWPQGRDKRAAGCCKLSFTLADLFWPQDSGRTEHYMLYGLGNDEIGYLVNKSDFIKYHPILDDEPSDHYEESNSVGPSNESILKREYSRLADLLLR